MEITVPPSAAGIPPGIEKMADDAGKRDF